MNTLRTVIGHLCMAVDYYLGDWRWDDIALVLLAAAYGIGLALGAW